MATSPRSDKAGRWVPNLWEHRKYEPRACDLLGLQSVRREIGLALILVAGCDKVLGLQRKPPDASSSMGIDAAACGASSTPGLDDDGDGEVNETDVCPRVPHQGTADEDLDGVPDDCDPCPQLVGAAAGDDPECDGMGAACDPQPDAQNTTRFFGFATDQGLVLERTLIVNGNATMSLQNTNVLSTVTVTDAGAVPARFTAHVKLRRAMVQPFWSYQIVVQYGAPPHRLQIMLEKQATSGALSVSITVDSALPRPATLMLGSLTAADLTFDLQATIKPQDVEATAVIDGVGAGTVAAPMPPNIDGPVSYGVAMYRDVDAINASTTFADTAYFSYTTLVP